VPSVEKALGSLPVVAAFAGRLRIRDVIDGLCPVDDRSELTHGQIIEALVANRLTSPEPLVRVRDWASGYAVEEVFGLRAEQPRTRGGLPGLDGLPIPRSGAHHLAPAETGLARRAREASTSA
jgi:hypothetical protein